MKNHSQNWYASWFDTPFYHILYADRDLKEAKQFVQQLVSFLKLGKDQEILDFPCGKGRHAMTLNNLGYDVTGVDLSKESISYANQFSNDRLRFLRHDIRDPIPKRYDAIFNLFTSFGYFDSKEDFKVILSIKNTLKPNGIAVIDFMNSQKVLDSLKPKEHKLMGGIDFSIEKEVADKRITKTISFEHEGRSYQFQEQVNAYLLEDFELFFKKAGLLLEYVFGAYHLEPYNKKNSDRLIMVLKHS
jgi:SAM-dependent methyltransferase